LAGLATATPGLPVRRVLGPDGGWLIDWVILAVVINLISLPLNAAKVGRVNFHMTMNANGTTTIHHYHYSVLGGVIGVVITLLYGPSSADRRAARPSA